MANEKQKGKSIESEAFKDYCRRETLRLLKRHARQEGIEFGECSQPALEPGVGQWLSLIFVAAQAIKISFKVEYDFREMKYFAHQALAVTAEQVDTRMAHDFVKEYCNLCAGRIKKALEVHGDPSFMSLPLVTRGQDGVFFERAGTARFFEDFWTFQLSNREAKLDCSVLIEVFDPKAMQKILIPAFGGDEELGEVEFFN